ncbi:5000_t:CDS:1, partial [Dentiscutata erythropus]
KDSSESNNRKKPKYHHTNQAEETVSTEETLLQMMETTNPELNQAILMDAERIFIPNSGSEFSQDNLYNNTDKSIDIAAIKDQLKSPEIDIDSTEQMDTEPNQDGRILTE